MNHSSAVAQQPTIIVFPSVPTQPSHKWCLCYSILFHESNKHVKHYVNRENTFIRTTVQYWYCKILWRIHRQIRTGYINVVSKLTAVTYNDGLVFHVPTKFRRKRAEKTNSESSRSSLPFQKFDIFAFFGWRSASASTKSQRNQKSSSSLHAPVVPH